MLQHKIIGRKEELRILDAIFESKEAQFIAIYGRRRVGKTFLIREYFSDKSIYLEASGAKDKPLKTQISNFMKAFSQIFFSGADLKNPNTWDNAFYLLTRELERMASSKKIVIFLDELPWMSTKKSGLLQSIDYYWNLHWSRMAHVILVVCGSSASWMLEKLIYAKGGLHKRITKKILLEPFNLKETKDFLFARNVKLNNKQILDIYMAIGGIPFYLKAVSSGMSAAQNIESICFEKNGLLNNEFKNLFESLFDEADIHLKIVRQIVESGNEITRDHLLKSTGFLSGGTFNKRLEELEASNFIQSFVPYGYHKRNISYRVIDEFSLFHLKWIEPNLHFGFGSHEKGYWQNLVKTPAVSSWAGYAFENICLKHSPQIRLALGLEKISCKMGRWRYISKQKSEDEGSQIDLLFDRQDGVITICEIKYCEKPFVIEKSYGKSLMKKIDIFEKKTKTKKQLFLAMICSGDLKENLWSEELVQNKVILDDLFT